MERRRARRLPSYSAVPIIGRAMRLRVEAGQAGVIFEDAARARGDLDLDKHDFLVVAVAHGKLGKLQEKLSDAMKEV